MSPRFAVLAIGDELMEGRHVDRNSAAISKHLVGLGFTPREHLTLPDDEDLIARRVAELAAEVDLIVSTGGLGPTLDDVTRAAFARAGRHELVRFREVEGELEAFFARLGREMAETNRRQADFPAGATPLVNPHGTAPGFVSTIETQRAGGSHTTLCLVMPGPPREMLPMLEGPATEALAASKLIGGVPARRSFYLALVSESAFAQSVAEHGNWMAPDADPRMGVTASDGLLAVELVARSLEAASTARLEARAAAFAELFGAAIYSERDKRLERVLVERLIAAGVSVATAESCTGGGVAAQLCAVPGASGVFERGFVTYSNAAKHELLGVPTATLEAHGAVSAETVEAMARGLFERSGARLCIAISGIAGPDGGSDAKPVGLVWFGLAVDGKARSFERRFPSVGRARVQTYARHTALAALLEAARELGA